VAIANKSSSGQRIQRFILSNLKALIRDTNLRFNGLFWLKFTFYANTLSGHCLAVKHKIYVYSEALKLTKDMGMAFLVVGNSHSRHQTGIPKMDATTTKLQMRLPSHLETNERFWEIRQQKMS